MRVGMATLLLSAVAAIVIEPEYADVHGGATLTLTLARAYPSSSLQRPHCVFGAVWVPAVLVSHHAGSSLRCTVPASPDLASHAVSVMAGERSEVGDLLLSEQGETEATLVYYKAAELPTLSAVSPSAGRASEPTEVRLFGSNFAPLGGGTARCAFGAVGLSVATFVSPTELKCESPVVEGDTHSVAVEVSNDGYGFSPQQAVLYTFGNPETEPQLRKVVPDLGPLVGAQLELHGYGFYPALQARGRGGALVCDFGGGLPSTNATFVTSTLLRCKAPASKQPQTVTLTVRALGPVAGMAPLRSTARAFTYYADAPPTVTSASPAYGDLAQPPPYVQLEGRGFAPLGDRLTCAFGDDREVRTAASFVSAVALRCAAPEHLPLGAVAVAASLDGAAFSAPAAAASYISYDSRLPPVVASALPSWAGISGGGGAPVVVSASNVAPTADLACVFDEVGRTAATLLDAGSVACAAPPTRLPHTTQLRLTLDGELLSPSSTAFTFHDAASKPTLSAVVPSYADAASDAPLTLYGKNFAPGDASACVFTAAEGVRVASVATFVSSGSVRCTAPLLSRPLLGTLALTLERYDPSRAADPADPLSPPTPFSLAAAADAAAGVDAAAGAAAAADAGADADAALNEANAVAFTWFDPTAPPIATAVSPAFGSVLRRLTVTVRGGNFVPLSAGALRCRFGEMPSTAAVFLRGDSLVCTTLQAQAHAHAQAQAQAQAQDHAQAQA